MAASLRALGPLGPWLHAPLYSQTSARGVRPAIPPTSTHLPRKGSNAIVARRRAGGPAPITCVHVAPSHSHVSPRSCSASSPPPKSTTRSRIESYAIAWYQRAEGPVFDACAQSVPFQTQVSPSL